MDQDIRELNRTYLLKAREYAMSGEEHKARFIMGISGESLNTLKRLSIRQVNQLADSDLMCFHMRYPASALKSMERIGNGEGIDDLTRYQLLSSLVVEPTDADS